MMQSSPSATQHDPAPVSPDMDVASIIFVRNAAGISGSVFEHMRQVREELSMEYASAGIFSLLQYQSGHCMRWMEGRVEPMRRVVEEILRESQDRNMRLIYKGRGMRTVPTAWSMTHLSNDESFDSFSSRVDAFRKMQAGGMNLNPKLLWLHLCVPLCNGAQAPLLSLQRGWQSVLVCSSQGDASFRLVRWLGEQNNARVVHMRISGMTGNDVACDYVDVEHFGLVRRVVAVARNGLHIGFSRMMLPTHSHVVMLLSGVPRHDLQLTQVLCRITEKMPRRPLLVGMGLEPVMQQPLQKIAESSGMHYGIAPEADCWQPGSVWNAMQALMIPPPKPQEPPAQR